MSPHAYGFHVAAVNTLTQDEWRRELDREISYSKNVWSVRPSHLRDFLSMRL